LECWSGEGWLLARKFLMILARVVGTVVATRKDERLEGRKLLVCRPVTPAGVAEGAHVVAVDAVGAGYRETVLLVSGSSARMATGKDTPVDSAVVGIVDTVEMESEPENGGRGARPAMPRPLEAAAGAASGSKAGNAGKKRTS
jgi:microcompartment protein CcmK/EutM